MISLEVVFAQDQLGTRNKGLGQAPWARLFILVCLSFTQRTARKARKRTRGRKREGRGPFFFSFLVLAQKDRAPVSGGGNGKERGSVRNPKCQCSLKHILPVELALGFYPLSRVQLAWEVLIRRSDGWSPDLYDHPLLR